MGLGLKYLRTVRVTLAAVERRPLVFPLVVDDVRRAPLAWFPYVVYFVLVLAGISVVAEGEGGQEKRPST